MNINQLATAMNQTLADAQAFVDGVSVWFVKGYTLEQSIAMHLAQMKRLASQSHKIDDSIVVYAFFGEHR